MLLIICCVITWFSQLYFCVKNNNPKDMREISLVKYTIDFSNGINPYAVKLLESQYPFNAGCYGFAVPLILSPLLKIFGGIDVLIFLEAITTLVSFLSGVIIYKILEKKCSKIIASFGMLVMYFLQLLSSGLNTVFFPGQYGVFVSTVLILLLLNDEEKKRFVPIKYVLIIILLFYIKQYYIFIGFPILIYLFIKSKKDALRFVLYGIILGILSMLVVQMFFPLYFSLAIGRAYLDATLGGLEYSFKQVITIINYKRFWIIYFGVFIYLVEAIKRKKYNNLEFILFFTMFLPSIWLSRNQGQNKEYLLQLWMPYVLIVGAYGLKEFSENFLKRKNLRLILGYCILFIFSLNILKWEFKNPFDEKIKIHNENWEYAYELMDEYNNSYEVIVPPQLSWYCQERGLYTDDFGQGQFMSMEALEKYNNNRYINLLFPDLGQMINIYIDYNEKLQSNIDNRMYNIIVLNEKEAGSHTIDNINLNDDYKEIAIIPLQVGKETINTYFYVKTELCEN